MLNHLRKKIKVDPAKFIIDMEKYGNTSSASIPLALCSSLADILTKQHQKILMAGFGVGWSWGAMIADVGHLPLPEVVHIEEDFETLSL
jgi:3-oxoacyl-[acyl-carrier-protein] synthase-3